MNEQRIAELEAMHERGTIRRGHIDEMLVELRRLHERTLNLLEVLIQADSDFYLAGHDPGGLFRKPLRAAIAKATGENQ